MSGSLSDNDDIIFAEEDSSPSEEDIRGSWKIIISDDEEEVHNVTQMVLKNTVYKGRDLQFFHAYSGEETVLKLKEHPDAALLLLDVVMEQDDSGLKIIKEIRQTLENHLIRIVIRTGQPGEAPEKKVIVDYDINDYKEKTELTSQKLFSTVIASLRAYDNLLTIHNNKRGIEQVLNASNMIFRLNTINELVDEILTQVEIFFSCYSKKHSLSGFIGTIREDRFKFLKGMGQFQEKDSVDLSNMETALKGSLPDNEFHFGGNIGIGRFCSITGEQLVLYLKKNDADISLEEVNLLNIFKTNVVSIYNKICLTREIENTQREVLFTLGEVVENRSIETGWHVKRVAEYSAILGEKYGLPPGEVEILRQASPMHDIGKVGIKDDILNKPGKLTPEEFELMKKHTLIGYEIFKNSNKPILQAAAIIALQHHERYGGQGYPSGLTGEDIHIYGRITCLADVFDALGSSRIYKKAWGMEDILDFVRSQKGQMFDPALVDIFFNNIEEILRIKDNLSDKQD